MSQFKFVVLMPAFNEEDIIVPSIRYLVEQGICVYVVDNWSTDRTHELACSFLDHGVVGVERFPKDGPIPYNDWRNMLRRLDTIAQEIEADWFLLQGVDEIHCSPWAGVSLIDGIRMVDQAGFNCIDHAVMTFHPVDDGFQPGEDFERYFRYFEWSNIEGHARVQNGWKNTGQAVGLGESGGHEARFPGRRVFPHKFLLKHYPIRSQAHGERKVFRERKPRHLPENKAADWHKHYDLFQEGHNFVKSRLELLDYDQERFRGRLLPEGSYLMEWGQFVDDAESVEALRQATDTQRAQIRDLQARIAQMEQSASWRLTRPLRRARDLLKRL